MLPPIRNAEATHNDETTFQIDIDNDQPAINLTYLDMESDGSNSSYTIVDPILSTPRRTEETIGEADDKVESPPVVEHSEKACGKFTGFEK